MTESFVLAFDYVCCLTPQVPKKLGTVLGTLTVPCARAEEDDHFDCGLLSQLCFLFVIVHGVALNLALNKTLRLNDCTAVQLLLQVLRNLHAVACL